MDACIKCGCTVFDTQWFGEYNHVCAVCGTPKNKKDSTADESYDAVHHPSHYANGMSVELECIMFKRWLPGDLSDAFKYIWRAGNKDDAVQDLEKAVWYIDDALEYGIVFNEPKLVPFLPKSSLVRWKYDALRCILTGDTSAARDIVITHMQAVDATAHK